MMDSEFARKELPYNTSYAALDSTKKTAYHEDPVRSDRLLLLKTLFFLFGMLHLMTITFIITANDYWMYKFRNATQESINLETKTDLQYYFTSGTAVAQAIPTIVCTLLATSYGHKLKVNSRIYGSLGVIFACYLLCTIFISIDVDSWQTGFFAITMIEVAVLQAMLAFFQVTSLVILAKFPTNYMKPFLFGQGIAGIFSSCLQVTCLAIGGRPQTTALIYFSTGSLLILMTIVMFYVVNHLDIYRYHMTLNKDDTKQSTRSYGESWEIAKQIWPCLVIFMTYVATLAATHPSVTTLVVSEGYSSGNPWNTNYFVPVITFLFSDICSLVGRVSVRGRITKSNGPWLVSMNFLRSFLLIPMIAFCNTGPRQHMAVVFNHDWQYIIILGCLVFTNGFIQNLVFLSIPTMAPGKEEEGLLVLIAFAAVATGLSAPLGIFVVYLVKQL